MSTHDSCPRCSGSLPAEDVVVIETAEKKTLLAQCDHCNMICELVYVLNGGRWFITDRIEYFARKSPQAYGMALQRMIDAIGKKIRSGDGCCPECGHRPRKRRVA